MDYQTASNPDEEVTHQIRGSGAEMLMPGLVSQAAAVEYSRNKCLHQLIEEQVVRTPDAVAVEMGGQQLTYRELNRRAMVLAGDLRALGVGQEALVGLCMKRSPDLVVALFGILKAGGAYVPLDPHFPSARLAWMLKDAAVMVLITQRSLADRCADFDGQRLWWDDWQAVGDAGIPPVQVLPHNAAYVIYTSGSTGRPKGVVLEHRAVVNFLQSMRTWPGLGPTDMLLAVATVSFDISVLDIFLPLIVGARVLLVPDDLRVDGAGLAALLASSGATVMQATPTTWQMLLVGGWLGDGKLKALSGGEAMSAELARALLERCGEVWNLYGPTETAVYSLGTRIEQSSNITIGMPVANTCVYVVDPLEQLVSIGDPGELWIGGEGLARGYLNRPELTAEKFIADPFQPGTAARVYRTGDRCRWLADGTIECLGRFDQQVKIRGHRIELGEIETMLRTHPAVRECAVNDWEALPDERQLAGYVVPVAQDGCSSRELREFLALQLPDYMVPLTIEMLTELPMTPNGKLDRRALLAPVRSRDAMDHADAAPRSALEESLVGIWSDVFGIQRIGRDDNFFQLGGHSLLANRLALRIERTLGVRISIGSMFDRPTIAQLAGWLNQQDPVRIGSPPVGSCSQPDDGTPGMFGDAVDSTLDGITGWDRPRGHGSSGACIHELFEAQARQTPDAMAVRCDGRSLTYADLNRRANELAHELRDVGIGPEVLVGAFLERSLEFAVALLGVLKAGGVLVPIDPNLPAERLAFIIGDTRVPVVVTDLSSRGRLPAGDAKVLCLGSYEAGGRTDTPVVNVNPENLAWVLYTSGSTGLPKGVMLTHAAYLDYHRAAVDCLELNPSDCYLQFSSFSFDVGVDQLLTPLLVGASVEICGTDLWHPEVLADFIGELGLTVIHLPSAYWNEWVEVLQRCPRKDSMGALRLVEVGGDVMPVRAARAWADLGMKSVRLINRYGPTEAMMFSTAYRVPSDSSVLALLERIPIGKPFGSRVIRLLDATREPVPVGEVGEIFIGGGTLARGYLNRPELTTQRFIPDPYEVLPGARLYQTGDLARLLPDGNLDFLGRTDFQVKLRGFRIELGEIDQVMKQHPRVREAVTVLRTDASEDRFLVTYLVVRNEAVAEQKDLRLHAKDRLPEYMIPAHFVILERLPLTPNGKADRRALLQLESPDIMHSGECIKPRNPLESQLAAIWQATLAIPKIGMLDNFFDLGVHSLLAMRVISRINREMNRRITVRQLIDAQTIERLADLLVDSELELQVPLQPLPGGLCPRLSFAQERLWFLAEYEPESTAYNLPQAYRLVGDLCIGALEQALAAIIQRHQSLRTTFGTIDNEPRQIIANFESFSLPVVDLSELPLAERESRLQRLLAADEALPFDLAKGPLFRTILIRLDRQTHIFFFSQHHVISDGWSLRVFCNELVCHYNAFKAGQAAPMPPLAMQYADYAEWQRQWLQGEVLAGQARYWLRHLADAPVLEIPTDRPRPPMLTHAGAMQPIRIPGDLSLRLNTFNRELAVTPFMSLLAVFQVVLSRYSGQTDIVVGIPIANRQRVEVEDLIGFFVNTLVMRADLTGEPGFREVVRRGRQVALDAFENQDLPFEELVRQLNPARDQSRHPLFQVLFAMQNAPHHPLELDGLQAVVEPLSSTPTHFDLELHLWQVEDRWEGSLIYNTGLFDPATIGRMVGHYLTLLASCLREPGRSVMDVPMLTAGERHQLLIEWNSTATDYPRGKWIHQLFEEQAGRTPDAVAVELGADCWTYHELDQQSNRVAMLLRRSGVGAHGMVAVCVEPSIFELAGVIGILKAGASYLPLDPEYPLNRLTHMLHDSGSQVLLTEKKFAARFPDGTPLLFMEDVGQAGDPIPNGLPIGDNPARDLAYVIYTSGSSGTPKGVCMTHAPLVNLLCWQQRQSMHGTGSRTLHGTSLSFDVSFQEIFATLCFGGTLVILPAGIRGDMSALMQVLDDRGVNRVFLPFVALEHLAEEVSMRNHLPDSLCEVITAGEQLRITPAIVRMFSAGKVRLINQYGPTEAHVVSSHELTGPAGDWPLLPAIGRPIDNVRLNILDQGGNLLPIGICGELHIGGVAVAQGYLNQPSMTAEKFVVDSLCEDAAIRCYRTGDRCRWLADGTIEYLGRFDQQIKIRGYRIEPGEVEAVLQNHPDVRECAVTAWDLEPGDRRLIGYVIPECEDSCSNKELRDFLCRYLPEYMVPASYVMLAKFPLTASGKVDRMALSLPRQPPVSEDWHYSPPRSPVEEVLVGIWSDVLRNPRIGRDDNFFELGGHSLLATRVASRIERVLGIRLSVRQFIEAQTIVGLVSLIGDVNIAFEPPLQPPPGDPHKRLSFAQERLWFLAGLEPESTAYNLPQAYRLVGDLCIGALEQALAAIIQRHQSLRTTFGTIDNEPRQIIANFESFSLPVVDLSELPLAERESRLQRLLAADEALPFDLAKGPLFRTILIRLDRQTHIFFFSQHHVISDGWSLRVFCNELVCHYNAFKAGQAAPMPPLAMQYADYAEWQRQWLQGEVLAGQARYWLRHLADAPVLEIPTDRPRPPMLTHAGAMQPIRIPGDLSLRLNTFNRELAVTPFMSLLAVFQVVLSRYSGQTDIVVGIPIANRQRVEVEDLIGFFVNTLVMRADLTGEPGFREVVRRGRQVALDAFENQDLPFEELVRQLNPARDQSRHPLFQVLFAMQNAPHHPLELDGLQAVVEPLSSTTTHFDLELHLWQVEDRWEGSLIYNTGLFDPATIGRMVGHYLTLLASCLTEPGRSVMDVPMLTAGERHQLLIEWNSTATDYPREKCIHQLFEEQAGRTPDAVAVMFNDRSLTYSEIDQRSTDLARQLWILGVRPDMLVAVRIGRSPELIIGLLGILKVGAAYWGVEDRLPTERLRMMMADARPRLLLASGDSLVSLARSLGEPASHSTTIVAIEDLLAAAVAGEMMPMSPMAAGMPAYVSYTSGSTGTPKGVIVPHRGVVRLVKGNNYVVLSGDETLLHHSPLSFDASTFEIWGALLNGGRLVLIEDGQPSLEDLAAVIRERGVTTLWLTAGLFHLMVDHRLEDLKGLRQLLAGGDVLSPVTVRKASRNLAGCRIINGYGPTENTTFTCCHEVLDDQEIASRVPIGRPISNTRVYVLDPRMRPVPIGIEGELYTGGDGVACGYLNQSQLTAERFLADPFQADPAARLYRTGDRCRWLADGTIDFLGRLDQQVKIRGYRIELAEVEGSLLDQPEVGDAVVVVREIVAGDKCLVAYMVATPAGRIDSSIMRERLGAKLPNYMVPSAFVWLDQMPLTPSGKTDRLALPQAMAENPECDRDGGNPISLLELKLIAIWGRLFERHDVGRRDDFFALGGHSLLAARLAAEIDKVFGSKVAIATLFQSPTVEMLARRFSDENWAPPWASLVPLKASGTRPPLFFVHGWGGSVFSFLDMARELPDDQPCYGIQAVGLDGKSDRHHTVEAMAEHYVREIVSFKPDGAIYLAGYSMGGIIAYEVAQQLHRQGRRVAMLALLDSTPVGRVPWIFHGLRMAMYLPRRMLVHFQKWWALPIHQRMGYLHGRWDSLRHLLRSNCSQPVVMVTPSSAEQTPVVPGFNDYYVAVASAYEPCSYPGCADVFVSDEADPAWRWYWRHRVRGGVVFHQAKGDHHEMLRSPACLPGLANSLNEALLCAQAKEATDQIRNSQTHADTLS
jgi:amino acid adenylation domain-containing protein